jgi:hypothetical protein
MPPEEFCADHTAHAEHLRRLDGRMDDAESDIEELKKQTSEMEKLIARIDVLVGMLEKTYWVLVVAIAGGAATFIFSIVPPIH